MAKSETLRPGPDGVYRPVTEMTVASYAAAGRRVRQCAPPSAPYDNARLFVEARYDHPEHARLVHQGGEWFAWSGSCWPVRDHGHLRAQVYRFFERCQFLDEATKSSPSWCRSIRPGARLTTSSMRSNPWSISRRQKTPPGSWPARTRDRPKKWSRATTGWCTCRAARCGRTLRRSTPIAPCRSTICRVPRGRDVGSGFCASCGVRTPRASGGFRRSSATSCPATPGSRSCSS
jgi:hypothetical protein